MTSTRVTEIQSGGGLILVTAVVGLHPVSALTLTVGLYQLYCAAGLGSRRPERARAAALSVCTWIFLSLLLLSRPIGARAWSVATAAVAAAACVPYAAAQTYVWLRLRAEGRTWLT